MFCNNGGTDRKLQRKAGSDEDSEADDRALSSVLLRIRQAYAATHGDHNVNSYYNVPEFDRRLQEFELCDVTGDDWTGSTSEHAQNDDFEADYLAPEFTMHNNSSHVAVSSGSHGYHRIAGAVGGGGRRPTKFCCLIVPPFLRPIEEETNSDGEVFPVTPDVLLSYPADPAQRGRHYAPGEEATRHRDSQEQEQKQEEKEKEEDEEAEEEKQDVEDTSSYWAFDDVCSGSVDREERSESDNGQQPTNDLDLQLRDLRSGRDPTKDLLSCVDGTTAFPLTSQPNDTTTDRKRAEDERPCSHELNRQGRRSNEEGLSDATTLTQRALPVISRQDHEDQTQFSLCLALSDSPRIPSSQSAPELTSGGPLPVHCACPRAASMTEPSVVVEWLDWTGLFFLLLTSGSTFIACLTCMSPSCLVAFISLASFISFPLR